MLEERNEELIFKEGLEETVNSFGKGSQEGAKVAIRNCQGDFGYVSISHQRQIADAFGLDEKIIKTIIKFMPSIKESKVEYEIVCCTGPRCAKNGSMEVLKTVKSILGMDFNETSKDGRIRLRAQNCFKKCKDGPNIMINGKFYHHMDVEKTRQILDQIK
ncbi:NADH-quinone oxidoreductase subunit NuoE family protein [Lagierella massiliensis]|uniref:NADH-quinone oxidoreductase subunit NuoE family protein n=1 Tax=Lagierella massiliensis TaxID=1689303 RepID=UPI0006D805B6|nr:NAD(P)H-dependent oxidoreductase subunit E [Lagierella massiliensis]